MNYTRLLSSIDVDRLQSSRVAVVGTGGGRDLACDLVRSGVGAMDLYDLDYVEEVNLARQGFLVGDVGLAKVEATGRALWAINPNVTAHTSMADITRMTDGEIDDRFRGVDLLILATDRFTAQAKGNEIALRLGIPAVWIGLYAGGLGGEAIFWHPEIDACFRCLCARRYEAHAAASDRPGSLDPASEGATILDIHLVDAIAGQVAIGLLTRGTETRYGRLIDELGDRNFIQVKIDPGFQVAGRDVVRNVLGVPAQNDAYFAWNTVARRDPDRGQLLCEDCRRFRGHAFVPTGAGWLRVKDAPQLQPVEI